MTDTLVFTLLGTGSSGGVPRVGNDWGNCDSTNPKNRRRRCAMLIERCLQNGAKTTVVVDAGADLREQLLAAEVSWLDAVLLTHPHADHIFGLDDVRQLAITHKDSIHVHMDRNTADVIMSAFRYCFRQALNSSYPPFCIEHRINHPTPVTITGKGGSIVATPLLAEHGDIHALGFRIHNLVYLPDIKRITDAQSIMALKKTDILIIDALRYKPHPTHLNVSECLEFIEAHKPQRAILTNMHSDLDYANLLQALPKNVEPGFDGLKIELEVSPR